MDSDVRGYLARIGRNGGLKSRRVLAPNVAREMVRLREARRAFARFQTQCFWSTDPDYVVTSRDIPWVADQLRKYGGRSGWELAARLCR